MSKGKFSLSAALLSGFILVIDPVSAQQIKDCRYRVDNSECPHIIGTTGSARIRLDANSMQIGPVDNYIAGVCSKVPNASPPQFVRRNNNNAETGRMRQISGNWIFRIRPTGCGFTVIKVTQC